MHRIKKIVKKAFTPVTIMVIPHSDSKSWRIKLPSLGVIVSIVIWAGGSIYLFSIGVNAVKYKEMNQRLNYYASQFIEVKATIASLKKADTEFKRFFSFSSKEKILENLDTSDSGSIDMEDLKKQIRTTMASVGEIKDYLSQQRDIYVATPKGWPVEGYVTSPFGLREHPTSGESEFHSGVDIAAEPGRPVKATGEGIVSFSGWNGANGNLVVIEHGAGFSTFYAHNKMVAVRTGQRVKRGDIISYIGSTGNSTGPHVHYEVWLNGKAVNPDSYLKGRS
jgi:murein DD-endopeptidase MepM/ murein hydrolase activator NlpD